jgi:Fic family protein
MTENYYYPDLQLIEPEFTSTLTDLIIELDYLRKKNLGGTTHPKIFFQLKNIFHFLESLESARIEGNRTTIAELVERKIERPSKHEENFIEIENVERAINFIDENITKIAIDRIFFSKLHEIVVSNLSPQKEGDPNPGKYRMVNVKIAKAKHVPPDYNQVYPYMEQLITFINRNDSSKYDLLKTALAHHRFVWIHPFRNGNGRVVRLLTYAMLVKQGFHVDIGRILNPTAIFCNNRAEYYRFLAEADLGEKPSLLNWCEYVLAGLKAEIEKIDNLLDYKFLSEKILLPTLTFSLDRKIITEIEAKILSVAIKNQIFQAGDLKSILPKKLPAEISRLLGGLRKKKMIVPNKPKTRKYYINFYNNYLLRGIIEMLDKEGFLPIKDKLVMEA